MKRDPLAVAFLLSLFTIFYNIAEGAVSIWFGAGDETLALMGFGVDSFVEVLSGLGIAHMIRRMRGSPVTERDRFEKGALRVTSVAFFLLAAGLAAGVVINFIRGNEPRTTVPGIVIAALSLLVMGWLVRAKRRVGRMLNSPAILADAECTMTCFYLSLILLAASLLYEWLGIAWIDGIGSLGIAFFALREGREAWEKTQDRECSCSCK